MPGFLTRETILDGSPDCTNAVGVAAGVAQAMPEDNGKEGAMPLGRALEGPSCQVQATGPKANGSRSG